MSLIKNTARTIRQEFFNALRDIGHGPLELNDMEKSILSGVKKEGFYIIPDFYSEIECNEIRKEIDRLLEKYKNQVVVDDASSDHRILGADRISTFISKFFADSFINKIIEAHQKTKDIVGFTLAARLDYTPNNPGSGDGWHRDTAHNKQIKAIMYLSDVDKSNGPFQYIKKSHNTINFIKDSITGNFNFNQNRFIDEEISRLVSRNESRIETFLGKAGTLILVNTRGLHRGMPIENGSRYALTNYYWSDQPIPERIAKLMVKL